MKTNFINTTTISAFAALLSLMANAQTPTWAWAIDSNGPQWEDVTKTVVGDDGSIYALGRFDNTFTIGDLVIETPAPVGFFSFIMKLTPSGEVVWIRTFVDAASTTKIIRLDDFAVDSDDNIYFSATVGRGNAEGAFEVDIAGVEITFPEGSSTQIGIVAKLNPDGNAAWVRTATTPQHPTMIYISAGEIVLDENGLVYWQGAFLTYMEINGTQYSSMGGFDIYLACLNEDGEYLWTATMGSEGSDNQVYMASVSGGGVVLNSTWTGDTVHVGGLTLTNPDALIGQNADRWIGKIGADGNAQWLVREGGTGTESIARLVATPSGGAMVLSRLSSAAPITLNGVTYSQQGTLLTRYSSEGVLEQVSHFPNPGSLFVHSIASDGDDTYFIGIAYTGATLTLGDIQFNNAGGLNATIDFVVAAIDADGNPQWAVNVGNVERELLYGITYHPNQGLIACGDYTSSTLIFGNTTLENTGVFTRDFFIAALDFTTSVTNAPGVQPLHLYPNPAESQVAIDLTSMSAKQHTLRIFDTRGSLVLSQNVMGGSVETLEVSNLPKGGYVVLIHVDGVVHASKFIKL